MSFPSSERHWALGSLALLLLIGSPAAGQTADRWALKGALGPVSFVEGSGTATVVSLSAAIGRSWDLEPEMTYLYASPRESGFLFGLNLVRHYRSAPARLRPYLLTGLGLGIGSGNWGGDVMVSPTVGCGARVLVARGLFVAPEVRLGRVPFLRFTLGVGWSPGGGSSRPEPLSSHPGR